MAATLTLQSKSGTVKKLASGNANRAMDSNAMWFSPNATTMNTSDTFGLSTSNPDLALLEATNDMTIRFTADSSGVDGQGTTITGGFKKITIDTFSGSVYVLRAEKAAFNTKKDAAYADSNKIPASTGMELFPGDVVVGSKTSTFDLKYEAGTSSVRYFLVAVGFTFTSER